MQKAGEADEEEDVLLPVPGVSQYDGGTLPLDANPKMKCSAKITRPTPSLISMNPRRGRK